MPTRSPGPTRSRRWISVWACAMPLACGAATSEPGPAGQDMVARGAYLANAGDCIACHTAPGGKPLAGGRYIDTPFGAIASPNITPDPATGIGAWTDAQFYRAMHEGIGHRGEYLYPVMPFPWYTTVTRDDVMAIRAYLNAQPAVRQARAPNRLRFPYDVREALAGWRALFFKAGEFKPDPARPDDVNRGAYLVNGLAHCGECHNSRPVAGTSKWREPLQGGAIDGWYAPNITSDVRDGIGAWGIADIATFLKTGAAPGKGVALGPMAETVHSLSRLSDADLRAIAAYLKSTPPKATDPAQKLPLFAGRHAPGGSAYLSYCASCHGLEGQGLEGVVPALAGNGAVTAKGPQNVVDVVLGGLPARDGLAPMLAIGAGMTDAEVADAANYVRQSWRNAAPPTALPGAVAQARQRLDTPMNPAGARCPAVEAPALAAALRVDRAGLARRLGAVTDADMPALAAQLVLQARRDAPGVAQADLVNGLTAAYCDVLRGDSRLDRAQRALRLGQFSELVFMTAGGHGLALSSGYGAATPLQKDGPGR